MSPRQLWPATCCALLPGRLRRTPGVWRGHRRNPDRTGAAARPPGRPGRSQLAQGRKGGVALLFYTSKQLPHPAQADSRRAGASSTTRARPT
ncbi:MAG: hypothetical protein WKG07_30090 [Hymenobacter sp.]